VFETWLKALEEGAMAKSILGGLGGFFRGSAPIRIGVITSLAGPLNYYGVMQVRGLKFGIEYATEGSWKVFNREILLFIEDDAGDPGFGGQKARALIENKDVHILQGCTSSAVTILVGRIAAEYQRILIVEPAAADSITGEHFNRYIFRTAATTWQDAAAGGKYAVDHLGKTFCYIAPDSIWGRQSNTAWKTVIESHGGQTLKEFLVATDTQDFKPFMEEIKDINPEVLVQSWAGSGNRELFSGIRDSGIFPKIRVTGGLGDREARHALGLDAVGMVGAIKYSCILPDNPINRWLSDRHQQEYKENPDLFTAGGFAAGVALVEALKKSQADPEAETLIPILEGMRFEAAKGTYVFRREDHQALQPMYIVEMVPDPENPWAIPRLIRETSLEETAPPLVVRN
jgi:branched-chain amino acid transport system substrate-binding protein